ncbi:MAG TPA: chorismate lyase [Burkholderiaceae bacterium]
MRHATQWRSHVSPVRTGTVLHGWLTTAGSLTAKLIAHCRTFRVQRLHQHIAPCLRDEAAQLGLPRPQQAWEREVLLVCDGVPVVFAHTVVPLSATATDWPLFRTLGERSLGTTLFGDPLVRRGALQYATLPPSHPLAARAARALGVAFGQPLYARRCIYERHRGVLLVTEVFLPQVAQLAPRAPLNTR